MTKTQSTCIAITTDIDALAARVGHDLDVETDIWAAWDTTKNKSESVSEPIFRLGETVGANHKNEATNLLVLLVEGAGAERMATRLAPTLEARWKQRVLVEGATSPDGTQRRLRRSAPTDAGGVAAAPSVRAKPMTKHSGYAFAVVGARADFIVTRAVMSGTAPQRRIIIEGAQEDVAYELAANEDPESEGSFKCTWTSDDGDEGTASLDLMSSPSGDLALMGPYASEHSEPGFWAFHLMPDDDE